jgi:hypothetical protein
MYLGNYMELKLNGLFGKTLYLEELRKPTGNSNQDSQPAC